MTRTVRLSLTTPTEDVPRLLLAYQRTRSVEHALVLRPTEGRALLVEQPRGERSAQVWRSWASDRPEGKETGQAVVLRDGASVQLHLGSTGRSERVLTPEVPLPPWLAHGATLDVLLGPQGKAELRVGGFDGDVPQRGVATVTAEAATALARQEQQRLRHPGPRTLRGRWSGTCRFEADGPHLQLTRSLATYGALTVRCTPALGWGWTFEREATWFGPEHQTEGHGFERLSAAIEAGVLGAMALVQEACAQRDTRRRAAFDPAWAARHPDPPVREMKNPLALRAPPEPPAETRPAASHETTAAGPAPKRRAAGPASDTPRRRVRKAATVVKPPRRRSSGEAPAPQLDAATEQALLAAFQHAIDAERRS